jgi:hypothetical protein
MKRFILSFFLVALATGSALAQDSCATATAIGEGTVSSTNVGATTGPDPIAACGSGVGLDVWYAYTPTCTGLATVSICPVAGGTASFDTVLGAWSGTCGSLVALTCNDDTCALQSQIAFPVTSGTVCYISVAGYNAASGTFTMNVSCAPPPSNDECVSSVTVTTGVNPAPPSSGNFFNNSGATTSAGWATTCSGVAIVSDVWYNFTPSASGIYQVDTEIPAGYIAGSITDTILEVYGGSCVVGPAIACDDDAGVTGSGLLSLLYVNLTAATTYQIRVGAYTAASPTTGTFYLTLTFLGAPLANDDCGGGAIALAVGTNPSPAASGFTFNNIAATNTIGYPAACATIINDVWFSFTPGATDTYVFDTNTPCGFTAGTMTNTTIALYDAAACSSPAAALACDADSGTLSLSLLQAPLTGGNTYYLRVGATTNVFQTFYVNVRQGALATNDECAGALTVTVGINPAPSAPGNFYSNDLATNSAGWSALTGCASPVIANDVFFSFTPPATGPYVISTNNPCGWCAGTAANTTLAVYATPCAPAVAAIACDADSGTGSLSLVTVTLTGGTPYLIRVGTTAATGAGTFYLNVNPGTTAVPNDTCATALTVTTGINPAPSASCNTFTNDFATSDTSGLPAVCGAILNDVWFVFTPPISGDYRIDTETPAGYAVGTNTNSTLAVYGSCAVGPALLCDADSGVTGTGLMSIVTASNLTGGVPVYIRVGSTTAAIAGTFYLNVNRIFSVSYSSPFGPGSLQFDIVAGPPNGQYYLPITFNLGAFPYGWLYGVDITLQEILDELSTGYPFVGGLNANGDATFGPIGGVPSGLTFYSVALGFPGAVIDFPTASSAPKSYTTP